MIHFLTHTILTSRERNRVIYTADNLHGNAGVMLGAFWPGYWVVRINPKYSDDAGLLAHEMGHVADYLANPWKYSWKMLTNWRYRWERETHYYAIQAAHSGNPDLGRYAHFIATGYRLPITETQALDKLKNKYSRVKMQQPAPDEAIL